MKELVLVPTPLQDELPLEPVALELLRRDALLEETILLVEEHKVGRQRWLKWGLPREAIERFVLFNEHTQEKLQGEIIQALKKGKRAYLLSDCGLPAFCDPGQKLVEACHKSGIRVTATPYPNSISLALALSGFSHNSFVFSGFVPVKAGERESWMKRELKRPETMIWMETPYRLKKLMEELRILGGRRELMLAMDLGGEKESLLRGDAESVASKLKDDEKKEFVLVFGPI